MTLSDTARQSATLSDIERHDQYFNSMPLTDIEDQLVEQPAIGLFAELVQRLAMLGVSFRSTSSR